jgi:hypothetical protein
VALRTSETKSKIGEVLHQRGLTLASCENALEHLGPEPLKIVSSHQNILGGQPERHLRETTFC